MHIAVEPSILYLGTPVVLISTINEDNTVNVAPMSSAWWLGWNCMFYQTQTLGLTPGWVGFVMATFGIGGVVGGGAANMWASRVSRGRVFVWAPLVAACGGALLLVANRMSAIPIAAGALFVLNAGQNAFGVNMFTCRQEVTPSGHLGRMDTTMRVSITGMASVGVVAGGFVASRAGIRTTLALEVMVLFVVAVGLRLSPLRSLVNQSQLTDSHLIDPGPRIK
jgi:MFS family permease